jgi:hypothetical protein
MVFFVYAFRSHENSNRFATRLRLNLKFAGEKDLTPSINFRSEGEGGKGQSVVAKGNAIPQKLTGTHNKKKDFGK